MSTTFFSQQWEKTFPLFYYPLHRQNCIPIFCFFIIEGFIRNRIKHGRNFLPFALISEITWYLIHTYSLIYRGQMYFHLVLGISILIYHRVFKRKKVYSPTSLGHHVCLFLLFNGGLQLYQCGFHYDTLHVPNQQDAHDHYRHLFTPSKWIGGLAFIPIAYYNRNREFIQGYIEKICLICFLSRTLTYSLFHKIGYIRIMPYIHTPNQ